MTNQLFQKEMWRIRNPSLTELELVRLKIPHLAIVSRNNIFYLFIRAYQR